MITETELLQYIHKTAEMGCEGILCVMDYVEGSAMQNILRGQVESYRTLEQNAEKLLMDYGQSAQDVGAVAKTSARVMSAGKLMTDHSISKIAEMTIEGSTMGINKTLKHLHDYSGDDQNVVNLANDLLNTQRQNIEQLQSYL
jgi:hypothetical protein